MVNTKNKQRKQEIMSYLWEGGGVSTGVNVAIDK